MISNNDYWSMNDDLIDLLNNDYMTLYWSMIEDLSLRISLRSYVEYYWLGLVDDLSLRISFLRWVSLLLIGVGWFIELSIANWMITWLLVKYYWLGFRVLFRCLALCRNGEY
jgi:uncharacterized membrane protein